MKDGVDRLIEGLRLVKNGHAPKLIISGGSAKLPGVLPESELVRQFVNEFSMLPDSLILIETESRNTEANARNTAKYLAELKIDRDVFLVTSASHMRRAKFMFENNGFKVRPVAVDPFPLMDRMRSLPFSMVPDAEILRSTSNVWREKMGLAYYRFK